MLVAGRVYEMATKLYQGDDRMIPSKELTYPRAPCYQPTLLSRWCSFSRSLGHVSLRVHDGWWWEQPPQCWQLCGAKNSAARSCWALSPLGDCRGCSASSSIQQILHATNSQLYQTHFAQYQMYQSPPGFLHCLNTEPQILTFIYHCLPWIC